MNELKKYLKEKIIQKTEILGIMKYVLTCQKCGHMAKIQNIEKLPKVCSKCKRSPYTGPGKRGRPKK